MDSFFQRRSPQVRQSSTEQDLNNRVWTREPIWPISRAINNTRLLQPLFTIYRLTIRRYFPALGSLRG